MTKTTLNKIGYCTALLTFLIATFILFAHYRGFQGDYDVFYSVVLGDGDG